MSTQRQKSTMATTRPKKSQNSCAKVSSSGSIIYNLGYRRLQFRYSSIICCQEQLNQEDFTVAEGPRPIAVFMCERVLRDVLRPDQITLVNMQTTLSVQAFPALVPLVFAYAEVSGSQQEFTYQFRFVDKQGKVLAASNELKVAASPNQHLSHKLIGAFQALFFPEEGNYELLLSLNGVDAAGMLLQIIKLPAEVSA